jgi:predicted HicB family RNase H-like nuclease
MEDNCLHGRILFVEDLITYQAQTIPDLEKEFREAVDDYLRTCKEVGKPPQKPYSGTFNIRIGPRRHQKLARYAALNNISGNEVIKKALDDFLKEVPREEIALR